MNENPKIMKNILLLLLMASIFFSCSPDNNKGIPEQEFEKVESKNKIYHIQNRIPHQHSKLGTEHTVGLGFAKNRVRKYLKEGDYGRVVSTWDMYQKDNPGSFEGHLSQAKAYLCLEDTKNAMLKLAELELVLEEKIRLNKFNAAYIVSLATVYKLEGHDEKGKRLLDEYTLQFPELHLFSNQYDQRNTWDYLPCNEQ